VSRSKRPELGPLASGPVSHLKVAVLLLPETELVDPPVLRLLMPDVLADSYFVPTYGRYEVATCPEVLPDEIALLLQILPRDLDRALAFDVADHLRHRVLRRDRDQHVHVVGHQMPLLDGTPLVLRKRSQELTDMSTQRSVENLAPIFWNEHDVVLALPLRVVQRFVVIHETPFVKLERLTKGVSP